MTPDFLNKKSALKILSKSLPDVFNHNLETVPRLYKSIRPGSRYYVSLILLDEIKRINSAIFTKSGLMVGLGESKNEIYQVMDDLRSANVDFLTIGQYLPPTSKHAKLDRFVKPSELNDYTKKNLLELIKIDGIKFNPILNEWKLSNDHSGNYISIFKKI